MKQLQRLEQKSQHNGTWIPYRVTRFIFKIQSFAIAVFLFSCMGATAQITNVAALVNAINNGLPGDSVIVGPGTFVLSAPLQPKKGMKIKGAGTCKTIINGSASWNPGITNPPDGEVNPSSVNKNAYLFSLPDNTHHVTISDMTLQGPQLHGAIYGYNCDTLELYNIKFENFLWCAVRTYTMSDGKIHDNTFINAGGVHGPTGAGIFATWVERTEIWNNLFYRTTGSDNFYGIKGREGKYCRIHHNTIKVDFSIEFPFENDQYVEIDHNWMSGVVSIPKYAGGSVPGGGFTFHIHHNYMQTSYALEWVRNGAEIDHNLFDFDVNKDYGNLISSFGSAAAAGPTLFHNNLVKNPGLGVMWFNEVFNNLSVYNNHVIANKTVTPRNEGLFGFNSGNDFSTILIKDNIFECYGNPRPLMRNAQSYGSTITNNKLFNIKDSASYSNPSTGAMQGPTAPLFFYCGAYNQYRVDGWKMTDLALLPQNPANPPNPSSGLNYSYYEKTGMSKVADLNGTTTATGKSTNFDISLRKRDDNFGFIFKGYINIATDGAYSFFTNSDEGSVLYIDTTRAVNNDGLHSTQEEYGQVYLKAGMNPVQVLYFEKDGAQNLNVLWKGPCIDKQPIPNGVLFSDNGSVGVSEDNLSAYVKVYPNPASRSAFISYRLSENSRVKIAVFDVLGKEVLPVINEKQNRGEHHLYVGAEQLQSGIYFVKMIVNGNSILTKKLTINKSE